MLFWCKIIILKKSCGKVLIFSSQTVFKGMQWFKDKALTEYYYLSVTKTNLEICLADWQYAKFHS